MSSSGQTMKGAAERERLSESKQSKYVVPAIDRVVLILRALQRKGPMDFPEILEETQLSKSTCFGLLRTATRLGLVELDGEHRIYRLGISLVELGASATDQLDYLRIVKRYIADLASDIDATFVVYRRLDPEHVSIIDKLERPQQVRITVPVGTVMPIQGGSFGRCFMAYDDEDVVDKALRGGLRTFTALSLTDVDVFKQELSSVVERGWAVDREGFALGVSTVAAPVFGPDGKVLLVIGAISIASLLDSETEMAWGTRLRSACDELSQAINPLTSAPWLQQSHTTGYLQGVAGL